MMKKFASTALALTLATLSVACMPINQAIHTTPSTQTTNISTAKEVGQLSYIENLKSPEDLVQIPNSKWIIASGMTHHSGLYLIDSQSKTTARLIAPKASAPSAEFKNSQPQPHADEMQIHGISIRAIGGGKSLLYAVNHNGFDKNITRETIEIFEVNSNTATPTITWLGNVPMPKDDKGRYLAANSVVSGADGAIYTTVMMHPEHNLTEMIAGNPAKVVATAELNYGVFDNLHWNGDKLITAGSRTENCGETMTYECLKDYHITTINPDNLAITPLYQGKYSKDFSGVSTVLAVGKTYYLGSFYRDKMAYFEVK